MTVELNRGRVTVYEPERVTVPGYLTLAIMLVERSTVKASHTAVTDTVELPATKVVASGQYVS